VWFCSGPIDPSSNRTPTPASAGSTLSETVSPWASGTQGTILRTTDDGTTWQTCTTPPEAEKLDFCGIQAFDANTAIVMSSGKGDLSRLYKTIDACKSLELDLVSMLAQFFGSKVEFKHTEAHALARSCRSFRGNAQFPLRLRGYPSRLRG
jgi:hypothetical protein